MLMVPVARGKDDVCLIRLAAGMRIDTLAALGASKEMKLCERWARSQTNRNTDRSKHIHAH